MTTARRFVGIVLAVSLVATAGCLGALTGDTSFDATPATLNNDSASSQGYQFAGTETQEMQRQFEVGDRTKNVTASTHITTYEKTVPLAVGDAKAGVVALVATPQVKVLGQTFNPVGEMSNKELVGLVQDNYKAISIEGEAVAETDAELLGKSTTVSKFEGSASLNGNDVPVFVHVTKVKHDGDFVVAVAIYPQELDGEGETVVALLEDDLQHGEA
jgi:hypothetical protein